MYYYILLYIIICCYVLLDVITHYRIVLYIDIINISYHIL